MGAATIPDKKNQDGDVSFEFIFSWAHNLQIISLMLYWLC